MNNKKVEYSKIKFTIGIIHFEMLPNCHLKPDGKHFDKFN